MSARLTIRWAKLDDLIADGLEDLAIEHWQEAEKDRTCPLAIDFERARLFEKQGVLKIAAMYRGTELVGYAECMILAGMFYLSTRHCYVEAIYISPKSRGLAPSLIHWLESRVAEGGPTKIYIAAKTHRQGDFYSWLGYEFSETLYSKTVGKVDEQRNSPDTLHAQ